MKVWVYRNNDSLVCGHLLLVFNNKEKYDEVETYSLLGTLDLPIKPVKKEVVKREEAILVTYGKERCTSHVNTIPESAYDVIIEYKVKE